jgi:hypothetical protein
MKIHVGPGFSPDSNAEGVASALKGQHDKAQGWRRILPPTLGME